MQLAINMMDQEFELRITGTRKEQHELNHHNITYHLSELAQELEKAEGAAVQSRQPPSQDSPR